MISFNTKQPGFSLTELMVYLAIVGVLAGGLFGIFKFIGRAKKTTTETVLRTVKSAIDQYRQDTGQYPNSLEDLVTNPGVKGWMVGGYLDKTPEDSWNNPIQYVLKSQKGNDPYDLYSYGPNGEGSPESEWTKA